MPICVVGMHRSGTSLVARLLHSAGLDLGDAADLLPPQPDNPEGFWENRRFTQLNDAILALVDATWFQPPNVAPGWQLDAKFDELRRQAADLVKSFDGREPWGWKDPRSSLTLPFWQTIVPDLKVVVCLRNPLEIAKSLSARDHFEPTAGVVLWTQYLRSAATAVPKAQRFVTHYESYFIDFQEEAKRLARFASLPGENVANGANDSLRHNRTPWGDLVNGSMPDETLAFYLDLCAEAGPVYRPYYLDNLLAILGAEPAHEGDHFGRLAVRALDHGREIQTLREGLERTHAELHESRLETHAQGVRGDSLQRELDLLREQLTWRRHRWADWAARTWQKVRRGFRS